MTRRSIQIGGFEYGRTSIISDIKRTNAEGSGVGESGGLNVSLVLLVAGCRGFVAHIVLLLLQ